MPRAPSTIFDERHEGELKAYLHTVIKKISKEYGLPYEGLIKTVVAKKPGPKKAHDIDDAIDLEMIHMNGKKYLYDVASRIVYSNDPVPKQIGVLDDDMNILPYIGI